MEHCTKNNYFRAAFFYYEYPKRFYRNDCKSVFSRIFRYEHCFWGAYFKTENAEKFYEPFGFTKNPICFMTNK